MSALNFSQNKAAFFGTFIGSVLHLLKKKQKRKDTGEEYKGLVFCGDEGAD